MSKLVSFGAPSIETLNTRLPVVLVQLQRSAKYSRTRTVAPAVTGKPKCISVASPGSQRSVENTAAGVPGGTVPSTGGVLPQSAELLPSFRYAVSPSQSGPLSAACRAGPPVLTR